MNDHSNNIKMLLDNLQTLTTKIEKNFDHFSMISSNQNQRKSIRTLSTFLLSKLENVYKAIGFPRWSVFTCTLLNQKNDVITLLK